MLVMLHRLRTSRPEFRRALVASGTVHVLVAVVLVIVITSKRDTPQGLPRIDTRIQDVVVRMTMSDDLPVALPQEPRPTPPPEQPAAASAVPHRPLAAAIPNPLPTELQSLLRRPGAAAVQPVADPTVVPVSGSSAAPIHGAMAAGQTVVYVLDCSGSMGEFGKFAAARAALIATLRRQPESVRFQVIVYAGTPRTVFPGGCVAATAVNIADAETYLVGLRPSGPSNHVEAVRVAAALRPNVILILTDATDLSANKLKPVFAAGGKPVPVCVAQVSAEGVGPHRELR